ncbi:MAG: ArnT family glycosyltransferase [Anaerolineae bacterium]
MNLHFRNAGLIKWGLVGLFVLWLFFVAVIFYVTQKPLSPADLPALFRPTAVPFVVSAGALGHALLNALAGLWLWGIAAGVGRWLFRRLAPPAAQGDEAEAMVFGAGLGFGALGLLVLGLGLAGVITPPVLTGVAILLTPPAALQLVRAVRAARPPASPFPRPVQAYLALALTMALTVALLPPTDWDGLVYHLTGPKLYLGAGRIAPGLDFPILNYPGLIEMLFLMAMALRGDVAAKLMHFGFAPLLAALVYLTARRHLGLKRGWPALLVFFSMPMVLTLAGWAYNDLALAFFEVGSLYALLNWRRERAGRWLVTAGIFCGLAMSLKYIAVIAPLTLGLLLLWWQRGRAAKPAALFALPALGVAGPWYVKSWLFNPAAWLTLPYTMTLGLNDVNYIDGRTGPLFLAFLPLLLLYGLFKYRRAQAPPALNSLLFFALGQFAFWTAGVSASAGLWQSRHLLPMFTALSPALAWIVADTAHLNHPRFSLHRFLNLFIALVLLLGLVDQLFNNQINSRSGWLYYRPLAHLAGQESRAAYLTRRLGVHYRAMERLNAELPAGAAVAFLWEPRSYYCRLDCRPDSILDEYGHLQYLYGGDAGAIAEGWRSRGVTHVLVFKLGLDFLLADEKIPPAERPNPAALNRLTADYFEPTFDVGGAYQLYRIR